MNVMHHEYISAPQRSAACDIEEPGVLDAAERYFEDAGSGLFRDVDDPFNRKASSRQFVTNPSTTIPNDQNAFAQWLYGGAPSRKQSQSKVFSS